jgi:hypothetical protein
MTVDFISSRRGNRWAIERFATAAGWAFRISRKVPGDSSPLSPLPHSAILTFSKLEQANPILFMNIFSSILNDRGEMACPVLKDVLNAVQK